MRMKKMGRRSLFKFAGAAAAASFWSDETLEGAVQNVNKNSNPSQLKITDLRIATVRGAPMTDPIIRIDTNQGVYGLGEVRDGSSGRYALFLKSRILGENPCSIDKIFRKIKQFGGDSRQAGGVCAIEMALWDIAGKIYNVPVYQMLGGKFRDKIRCYADTTESEDPKVYGQRLKLRKEQGFTWLKMDLGIGVLDGQEGMVTHAAATPGDGGNATLSLGGQTPHMYTGIELTPRGVDKMAEYASTVREYVGYEIPLSSDHFGHIGVNSCIRLGKALEKYNLAWLEDMIPWQNAELLKEIKTAINIPLLTGEDIYLKENFIKLASMHAVDILHPDLATSGGILETHKIGDAIEEYGVAMAMHFAGSPVSCMANVHCAAATENFLVMENHSVDVPWWSDLVEGIEKPIVNKGFITVPDKPGLGVTLNDDVMKQHMMPNTTYFGPSDEWNVDRSNDRLWS
jgi:L-alanine-DL-glutamate epimerase-like enolase superfamily enzyme